MLIPRRKGATYAESYGEYAVNMHTEPTSIADHAATPCVIKYEQLFPPRAVHGVSILLAAWKGVSAELCACLAMQDVGPGPDDVAGDGHRACRVHPPHPPEHARDRAADDGACRSHDSAFMTDGPAARHNGDSGV